METMPDQSRPSFPLILRIVIFFGRLFGYIWVPEMHVQVIYHMSRYAGARAPNRWGLVPFNRFTETLGPLVYIRGRFIDITFKGMLTHDVVPVALHLNAFVSYDPDRAPDLAPMLTKCPPKVYPGIAESYLQWVLLAAVGKYDSTQLALADVKTRLEVEVTETVNHEMKFLGIQLNGNVRIMGVELPTSVTQRHEELVRLRDGILAARQFDSAELRRTWLMDALNKAATGGSGEFFINFNDLLLESYPMDRGAGPPIRIIDQPPAASTQLGGSAVSPSSKPSLPAPPTLDDSRLGA